MNERASRGGSSGTPTMREVARAAGVSVATVSRVLNHPGLVSAEVRENVQDVIGRMGYVPNGAARALTSRVTRTVGAVMPTIDGVIYAKMIGALQRTLEANELVLFIAAHEYSLSRELDNLRALVQRGVDAIILVGGLHDPAVYDLAKAKQIPLVLMCIHDPGSRWPTVGWDNRAGGAKIAGFVADAGHRRFGIIGGVLKDNDRATERVEGFLDALKARGIEVVPDAVVECRYTLADSARALAHLVSRSPRPTAILCGNDVLATGALLECQRRGIRVPEDLTITGYDDIEVAAHLVPPLTTLRLPAGQIGRLTAETVMEILAGAPRPQHVGLELDLIVRGTTGSLTAAQ